jgi:glutathione S-transferase
MVTLYDNHLSVNGYKVRMMLASLGVPFEIVWIDTLRSESQTDSFLTINPNSRIPALDDGAFVLPESNAILHYLADGTEYLPECRGTRARILQWMFFEQYSHEPNIAVLRH